MERRPPVKISILEKDESEVSHCWKLCQLFSYTLVVISGIATSLAMGNISRMFNHECILYADLAVNLVNWTISITPHSASRWGNMGHCNFCQFCPVASVIFAGIWGTIFIVCGRGGASSRNLPQPWRIIPFAILFNFIFLVLSCISVALTFGGFHAFCASIAPQVNVTSCEDLIGFMWDRYPEAINFYDDVVIAQTGAAVGLIGWLMGFVILLIRVITHADFRVIGPDRKASTQTNTQDNSSSNLSTILTVTSSTSSSTNQRSGGQPVINADNSNSNSSSKKPRFDNEVEPLITTNALIAQSNSRTPVNSPNSNNNNGNHNSHNAPLKK